MAPVAAFGAACTFGALADSNLDVLDSFLDDLDEKAMNF
jgi:hypothetical protein